MTIYFTTVFAILMIEIPLPGRWRRTMFKLLTTSPTVTHALRILKIIFGLDSANRLQRVDEQHSDEHRHDYGFEASLKARKFYSQRNLYLTGFTLFLSLILERTSTLVITMLKHEEELENTRSESTSSSKDHQRLLEIENDYKSRITSLKNELNELKQEQRDHETLKKQVAEQAVEYERLAEERNMLERKAEAKKTI
ncbi:B-cell receptor-associated 31-like protein [Backusella circina FSU 941]|nr:B-cell receptor-associated 31-like protein [Backusella circina FSU 941]